MREIKIGQVWEIFLGQTFEVKRINGNTVYGIGRSRQGTPNNVLEYFSKEELLKLKLREGNMEKLSQTKDVLIWLKRHKSITSWQAISIFGATRLSAIIYTLRGAGYDIESKPERVTNRYGHTSPIVKYIYRGQHEQAR